MTIPIVYPAGVEERSGRFWLRAANIWKGRRRIFRADTSNQRRYLFNTDNRSQSGDLPDPAPVLIARLARDPNQQEFRFIVLADSGQGTRSQYALLPLIRALKPDFMIINGDVAYPAGDSIDFDVGFFKPYRMLDIPVWATMGNHEYYSEHYGQEFYDVFCRGVRRKDWDAAGLRWVPQPGPYWELRQSPEHSAGLVLLGVDTGQEANLDGARSMALNNLPFLFHTDQADRSDARQHDWLQRRLAQADNEGSKVIVIYHIPGLVDQKHDSSTHLAGLHQAIASHPSVRLVVCGHIHNFQYYEPATFVKYMESKYRNLTPVSQPGYFVSGNAGAGLGGTEFKDQDFATGRTSPTIEEWREHRKEWAKSVRWSLKEWLLRLVATVTRSDQISDALEDADLGQFLSMVYVEVKPDGASATPVFLPDIREILATHSMEPAGSPVMDIGNPAHRFTQAGVNACLQPNLRVVLR